MTAPLKLGGFKVLKNVVCFSLISYQNEEHFPSEFCRAVTQAKINLPYISCLPDGKYWGLSFAVDASDDARVSYLIDNTLKTKVLHKADCNILSIFPHKGDPRIPGLLLDALYEEGLQPEAMVNSPSAISAILRKKDLTRASNALFGPFSFSAYRTPYDWTLTQKGKESLYKEVVASYQESKPKVYGLKYREKQELLHIKANNRNISQFGPILRAISQTGSYLSFLGTCPCPAKGCENIVFCLSRPKNHSHRKIIRTLAPALQTETSFPVSSFSMTGPHFGDRYGIASELLTALERDGVDLLALNCSIASIKGVVTSKQLDSAIHAIQSCFEVPVLIKKD